ncbi:MAG: OpgC domain-containing protein [Candidatus Microsaccharimonas sp.]
MSKEKNIQKSRLLTLDYLRGYFIVVIIIDHLARWPSIFAYISGQALLWVTAAEGFVAISGLLVGYIRGFKNKGEPMRNVTSKLLRRAGLLYLWSIIASIAYSLIVWYVPLIGGAPGMPDEYKSNWLQFVWKLVTLDYTFVWVYFLSLYALFLAFAPIAIWLLRKNMAWLVAALSLSILGIGWATDIKVLQWQVLFFIPSIVGFYLPSIVAWWKKRTFNTQTYIMATTISFTALTVTLSMVLWFYAPLLQPLADQVNALFPKDTMTVWRVAMAFLWFGGFFFVFHLFEKYIGKVFGWILLPFGTHSLTAYILHGLAICIVSIFTIASNNILINSILGMVCLLLVLGMLKIPFIHKVIPS